MGLLAVRLRSKMGDNFVIFAGIEYDSVKENYWVYAIQRTVLLIVYFGKNFVSYSGNQPL